MGHHAILDQYPVVLGPRCFGGCCALAWATMAVSSPDVEFPLAREGATDPAGAPRGAIALTVCGGVAGSDGPRLLPTFDGTFPTAACCPDPKDAPLLLGALAAALFGTFPTAG